MSVVGSPIETSILQAAQAQQMASKARDREKAASDTARRHRDRLEIRMSGVEDAEALRGLPDNSSEQAKQEHRQGRQHEPLPDKDQPRIDVRG